MSDAACNFDIIASTGRTATTYLASALNQQAGILACHEGYPGSEKETQTPALPLINLENARAYNAPDSALEIVREKRCAAVINAALAQYQQERMIDVAYYNPTLAHALLETLPGCRMIGLIRDCESFVRSCTTLHGEDPLPVGWPDPQKELSAREKFIAMGRIRPRRASPDKALWASWGAIRRNIWLWRETNLLLCAAKTAFPERVSLMRFETFKKSPETFWHHATGHLDLPTFDAPPAAKKPDAVNKKPFGYQTGPAAEWSADDQNALADAQTLINESADYDC